MGYTSGHYRKGHFRNGKWVSGGYVKGHYRSGLGYGSGLYSINTTEKSTSLNDKKEVYNSEEDFLNERRKYWRQIREKEGPAQKLDLKKQNEDKKREASDNKILTIVICVIVFGLFLFLLIALDPGSEVMNWFIAILVILALLKK